MTGQRLPADHFARRVAVVFFLAVSAGLIATGWWFYWQEAAEIRNEKHRNLAAFNELKAKELRLWQKASLAEAARAAHDSGLKRAAADFLGRPADKIFQAELKENLTLAMVGKNHANLLLYSTNVHQLIDTQDDHKLAHPAVRANLLAALTNQNPVLSDFFPYNSNGVAHIDVAVALRDGTGRPQAVLVVRHHAGEELIPMIRFWPDASPSTEVVLVQRESNSVVLLNGLLHGTNVTMKQRFPLTRTELPSVQAALGRQGRFESVNFIGIKVLADLHPIPGKPWGLFAKVNEAEILAEARRRTASIGLTIGLLILLAALGAGYYYRRRQAGVLLKLVVAEQHKVEAQETYRATLYSIGDGVITTDMAGRVREMNPMAERLTGWTEAAAHGRPLEEIFRIINEKTREPAVNPVQVALREKQAVGLANHTLLIGRDGTERPVADSAAPILKADGGISGVVLVFSDQTSQHAAQRALQASEERFRQLSERLTVLVEAIPSAIFFKDGQGRWLVTNRAAKDLFKLHDIDWQGKTDAQLGEMRPEFRPAHEACVTSDEAAWSNRQLTLSEEFPRDEQGNVRHYSVAKMPLFDAAGNRMALVIVGSDVTEHRRAETELQRLNRALRLISLLNQELAHASDEAALLQAACQLAVEVGGYRLAWLGFAEQDEAKTVRPVAVAGFDDGYLDTLKITWADVERGHGPVGMAIRTSQPAVIRNIQTDPLFKPWCAEAMQRGYASVTALPLTDGDRCFGALNLYASETNAFDAEEVKLLAELAGDLAYGIISLRHRAEREQMELALRESEERYRHLFARASIGIILLDTEGKIISANSAYAEKLGYRPEDMLGMKPTDLDTPETARQFPDRLRRLQAGEILTFEVENRHRNGHTVSFEVCASLISFGDKTCFQSFVTDITARKRDEAKLRLEGAALAAAANAIVITNHEGKVEWVNPAFTTFTGYSLAEVAGHNLNLLKSGKHDPAFYQNLWQTIMAGKVWRGEVVNQRKDGSLYHEDMTITALKNEHGDITHFIAVKQDITEQKNLEAKFRQSQKMEAVGQLAGGVAHDFNNLLAVIIGNVSFIQTDATPAEQKTALEEINRAAQRAAGLTRQLLAFGRRQVMQIKTLDLNHAVTDMIKMLQRIIGEDVSLQTSLLPGGAPVQADPSMLDQVLLNLAVNARDAMPNGGRFSITIDSVNVSEEIAATHHQVSAGKFIRLRVEDTGCGISPEVLPHIFEPFFTTKDVGKGSGLGLSTVYGIMEQHHGWIEVESALGRGTVFQVFWPRLADGLKPETPEEAALPARGGRETILLVEDEAALQKILTQMLKKFGYQVLVADNGRAAMELWRQQRDTVALLLTDIIMPEGVSGRHLADQLRTEKPDLKVIYISGYPGEMSAQDMDARHDVIFLQKPFSPARLAQAVRHSLDGLPLPPQM